MAPDDDRLDEGLEQAERRGRGAGWFNDQIGGGGGYVTLTDGDRSCDTIDALYLYTSTRMTQLVVRRPKLRDSSAHP